MQRSISRRVRASLVAVAVGALALAGCADASEPEATASAPVDQPTTEPTEQPPAGEVERDPALAALLESLITEELPPVSLRSREQIAAECGTEAGGCYLPEEPAIVVTSEWTDFRLQELLAHEFLHHVWERDGLDDDAELAAALGDAAADQEALGALVPPWQESYVEADGSILPTELFSYACTGLRADQMAAPIAERCAQYLHLDALPVAQAISTGELLDAIDGLRDAAGLAPLERNPHAAAASEARAALFTPQSQVPLDQYPESVRTHLDAGCAPARYGARLTRPGDLGQQAQAFDVLLDGALTSSEFTGVGVATSAFDFIDARDVFDERTLRVNATLVVVTVCG